MNGAARDESIVGILLAAGRGTRFDSSGKRNKLLQPLPTGDTVAGAAAKSLLRATGKVLAVIPAGAEQLCIELERSGCTVTVLPASSKAMSETIIHALSLTHGAAGWIIALADMPLVRPDTIARLVHALRQGAGIAVPVHDGRRGNPVAFDRQHLGALQMLTGDAGARALLHRHPVVDVPVDDPGIDRDIDCDDDHAAACRFLTSSR